MSAIGSDCGWDHATRQRASGTRQRTHESRERAVAGGRTTWRASLPPPTARQLAPLWRAAKQGAQVGGRSGSRQGRSQNLSNVPVIISSNNLSRYLAHAVGSSTIRAADSRTYRFFRNSRIRFTNVRTLLSPTIPGFHKLLQKRSSILCLPVCC